MVTGVAPAGRVELRGAQLRAEILQGLEAGVLDGAEEVHIIAHSMGGLDARFCLSPGNPDNIAARARVASLTTIGTPHLGSPVADILTDDNLLDRLDLTIPLMSQRLRETARELDLSVDGVQDLTSHAAERFNQRFPNHPDVTYLSYAGTGRGGLKPTCTLLLVTHGLVTLKATQENDGVVPVDSATWGEGLVEVWPADHFDEIGHDLDGGPLATPRNFDHLERYKGIIESLQAR
jgi:triacylglycerol lipase